jgi:hypothetical protein
MEPTPAERRGCKFEGVVTDLLISGFGYSDSLICVDVDVELGWELGVPPTTMLSRYFLRAFVGGRRSSRRKEKKQRKKEKKREKRKDGRVAEEFPTPSLDLCATCTAKRRIPPSFYSRSLTSTPSHWYRVA